MRNNKETSCTYLEWFLEKIAQHEISRILNRLNLPVDYESDIFRKFKNIWEKMNPEGYYRDPEILVPLVIYFFFRFRDISVNIYRLLEISQIKKKDFYCFVFQIVEYMLTDASFTSSLLTIDVLETHPDKEKFVEFLEFLEFYSMCPLCNKRHEKTLLTRFYFCSSRILKKAVVNAMKKPELHFEKCFFNYYYLYLNNYN